VFLELFAPAGQVYAEEPFLAQTPGLIVGNTAQGGREEVSAFLEIALMRREGYFFSPPSEEQEGSLE
jgi:hypothetical protein